MFTEKQKIWISHENTDRQNIIFSDEKWFCLKPHPNRQNTRFWSMSNPHKYDDTNKQGAEKIMAWAGIVDGRILPIVWFKPGESVNFQIYLN